MFKTGREGQNYFATGYVNFIADKEGLGTEVSALWLQLSISGGGFIGPLLLVR